MSKVSVLLFCVLVSSQVPITAGYATPSGTKVDEPTSGMEEYIKSKAELLIRERKGKTATAFFDILDRKYYLPKSSPIRNCGFLSNIYDHQIESLIAELCKQNRSDIAGFLIRYRRYHKSAGIWGDFISRAARIPRNRMLGFNHREYLPSVHDQKLAEFLLYTNIPLSHHPNKFFDSLSNFRAVKVIYVSNEGGHASADMSDKKFEVFGSLPPLDTLVLESLPVRGDFLKSGFPNLKLLSLSGCSIDDSATGLAHLDQLSALDLTATKITGKLLNDFAHHSSINLRKLSLASTSIDDDSITTLGSMTQLQILDVSNTRISPGGIAQLHTLLPRCEVLPSLEDITAVLQPRN